ncbi:MAG: sodium/proton-translocating pyrophosphatase, partial [Patescibacteria group bacterium]
ANVKTLVGLFIGGLMPFVFSAIALRAIGRGAAKIIKEARRQIDGAGGLMSGLAEPDYNRCLKIATNESLKRMVILGFLALIAPVALGVWLGAETLAGFLIGSILVGFLLSTFMANAGGAWDNAKKIIELSGRKIRTSETLEAAVVGDTIGDPFKDAVGPALNILIKLMAIISLIIIPLLALK